MVIHHVSTPRYVPRVTLAPCAGGTEIDWAQEFEDSAVADRIRHIVEPANEQNLNRLQALLAGEEGERSRDRRYDRDVQTNEVVDTLTTLFAELIDGASQGGAYILNSGDAGLLSSLDKLSAVEASRSIQGGATIAAHAQHVRYGLSLMNRWAAEGGNPFADATWDEAWKTATVSDAEWIGIRDGLRDEARRWLEVLGKPRMVPRQGLNGMVGSIAHLAYHLGAIRQIAVGARGPREGTFA